MLNIIRKFTPKILLSLYRKSKRLLERKKNSQKSTEEIFSEIYDNNLWGGEAGDFNSGGGTTSESIADSYIKCVSQLGEELGFSSMRAVDLGCGDMRIGKEICGFFATYSGVDIVKSLIEKHQKEFEDSALSFHHLNIIDDPLPDGDVCFVRQVLQHLSNEQILRICEKLKKYKYVLITEHLPTPNQKMRPNLDKPHGGDVRLYDNSGVFLNAAPFDLEESKTKTVLEVEGHGYAHYSEPWIKGVIRTVLYTPQGESVS